MSRLRTTPRLALAAAVVAVLGVAVGLRLTETNLAAAQTPVLTAQRVDTDPGLDPSAAVWAGAPPTEVVLTAQRITFPAGGSVPMVEARALHHDETLYVRLTWTDETLNDRSFATEDFSDAVAIEFPADAASSVPSVCMGQADAGVNIWYWRADSETGIPATAADAQPNALVDLYPSEDDLFYPARAAGNPIALADGSVQNLVAQAFGSLAPAVDQTVTGSGAHADGAWSVVIARPFAGSTEDEASFAVGSTTDVAFAVWDGANQERNGQKSVSQFLRLELSDAAVTAAPEPPDDGVVPGAAAEEAGDGGVSWPAAVAMAIAVPLILLILIAMFGNYREQSRFR